MIIIAHLEHSSEKLKQHKQNLEIFCFKNYNPASILYKSTAGRYRPVRVADGPIAARCRFIKNAYREQTNM